MRNRLMPYVLFDRTGRVVPSSLVMRRTKPMNGTFREVTQPSRTICCSTVENFVYLGAEVYIEPGIVQITQPADIVATNQLTVDFTTIYPNTTLIQDTFTIMYYDEDGNAFTTMITIPAVTKIQQQNAIVNWLLTVVKPSIPTLQAEIDGDRIRFYVAGKQAYCAITAPALLNTVFGGNFPPSNPEYSVDFASIYGDFTLPTFFMGTGTDPVPDFLVPYFPDYDVTFNVLIAPNVNQYYQINGSPVINSFAPPAVVGSTPYPARTFGYIPFSFIFDLVPIP